MVTNSQILPHDNYQKLLQEVNAIIVEHEFMSRWTLIEGYHMVGEKLHEHPETTVRQVAKDLKKSERTIQRCVQFYKKYPDLHMLPEGKNTSWNKIVNKYLPETTREKKPDIIECPYCKKQWEK